MALYMYQFAYTSEILGCADEKPAEPGRASRSSGDRGGWREVYRRLVVHGRIRRCSDRRCAGHREHGRRRACGGGRRRAQVRKDDAAHDGRSRSYGTQEGDDRGEDVSSRELNSKGKGPRQREALGCRGPSSDGDRRQRLSVRPDSLPLLTPLQTRPISLLSSACPTRLNGFIRRSIGATNMQQRA